MPDPFLFTLMILFGIAVLLLGGDFLVRGSGALAQKAGVPPLLIGLTIVAFGTSAPEMVVSATSAARGAGGIAIGNIVGSNIANIFIVLGIPALLAPLTVSAAGVRANTLIAIALTGLFIVLSLDGALLIVDGLILTSAIIAYVIYLAVTARLSPNDAVIAELTDIDAGGGLPRRPLMIGVLIVSGLVLLPGGAHFVVNGALGMARYFDVSESLIGLTLLALGTSLPELSTVIIATLRRQAALAIGNVIGSNIFNLAAVGGITGIAGYFAGHPGAVDAIFFRFDFWVMTGAMLIAAVYVFAKKPIGRFSGLLFILLYAFYLATLGGIHFPNGF